MLAELPTTRFVDIAGTSTALLEVGDGPPLLLLHGGIECGGAMWAPVVARLAECHRVVAPDLPGLGESAPFDRLDTEAFGRWLTGVTDETGINRATVVAHSLTGGLAARAATRAHPSIERLVVYAAPAVGPYRMPLRLRYVAVRFAIRPTARNAERFDRFALLDLDDTRRRDPDWYDAFAAYTMSRAREPHVKSTMRRLIASETKPIVDADLARIDIPVTLLWGRHDRMVPLAVGEAAAARYDWPLRVVEDAAHAPHIERPDAFVDALTAITASA
jgi:2-hydroxymuconate-semialdehyde hydrolase